MSDIIYDLDKWKSIMDNTQSNYANMIKRLTNKSRMSNFILVYYSLALIIYSITSKFYPKYFDEILSNYFSIILSVVLLVFSLINNNAKYSDRISKLENGLNNIKSIKRNINDTNIGDCKNKYYDIVDNNEMRDDVDFYHTVKHLCKEHDISFWTCKSKKCEITSDIQRRINNYLSELDIVKITLDIIAEYILNTVLLIIPVMVFISCALIRIIN